MPLPVWVRGYFVLRIFMNEIATIGMFLIAIPVAIVRWVIGHFKAAIVIVAVLVIAIVAGQFSKAQNTGKPVQKYAQNIPQTAYVGQTTSRLYLINEYKVVDNKNILLTDFYSYNTKWEKQVQPLPFQSDKIKITKR